MSDNAICIVSKIFHIFVRSFDYEDIHYFLFTLRQIIIKDIEKFVLLFEILLMSGTQYREKDELGLKERRKLFSYIAAMMIEVSNVSILEKFYHEISIKKRANRK